MKNFFTVIIALVLFSCSSNDETNINSGNVESEACTKIKEGVEKARQSYINSPQSGIEAACKLYLSALKDQQVVCGDSDGEIQKLIDSLKDCSDDN